MAEIDSGENFEEEHVHQVYEQIATHFSATRYKAWPIVDDFLRSLPSGAVGLDVGCGNGKYLTVSQNIFMVGSDRSRSLIDIAGQHQPHSAIVADMLHLPHPTHCFDFVISIAAIHHLSSVARRIGAIEAIVQCLRHPNLRSRAGQALIFVWALEQKGSRRGWDKGDEQDVFVPWVMKQNAEHQHRTPTTYQRYYHLYQKGELESNVFEAGGKVVRSGYDRDNWWVVLEART